MIDYDPIALEKDTADLTDRLVHNTEHSISTLVAAHILQTKALLGIVKALTHARHTSEVMAARDLAIACLQANIKSRVG